MQELQHTLDVGSMANDPATLWHFRQTLTLAVALALRVRRPYKILRRSIRMSDHGSDSSSTATGLFAKRSPEPGDGSTMMMTWGLAGLVVVLALVAVVFSTHRKPTVAPNSIRALDPYAASLTFADLQMSESSALSAVKVTYIDGHLRNTGGKTVSGATVQVLFGNDEQLPPQVETLPVTLIRTHEPYVDTEPVSADPIRPGQEREFRLIFENIGANWNQQLPQIRVVGVE
jgi:hypothetical protein